MGFEWYHENPHRGIQSNPKLTLAGRIDGRVDGRPVSMVVEGQNLVLEVGYLRTLLTLRHSSRSILKLLRAFVARSDIRLLVRIKWLGSVEVLPDPALLIRLMLPRK